MPLSLTCDNAECVQPRNVGDFFFLPHNVLAQPAICSSADSFEGVDGSFKWADNEAWQRSDLFNDHEHDGRIAQTMRKKANLAYRSYCVSLQDNVHLEKQEVAPGGWQ